ncbi:hypothetical protein DN613_22715 [Aeromonas caviae]|nr:hypothetical protein DN613_22715 [Aeromonas caviae]
MVYHAGNCGAWHPHPGARRRRHRILLSSNMSTSAHPASGPTFYFHVLQYVFFNELIYKGLCFLR